MRTEGSEHKNRGRAEPARRPLENLQQPTSTRVAPRCCVHYAAERLAQLAHHGHPPTHPTHFKYTNESSANNRDDIDSCNADMQSAAHLHTLDDDLKTFENINCSIGKKLDYRFYWNDCHEQPLMELHKDSPPQNKGCFRHCAFRCNEYVSSCMIGCINLG